MLEHLVDVVLQFEGERHSRLRLVRAAKNRYGPADEVGCFDLDDAGITGLPDPSGLFLSHGTGPAVGHLRDGHHGGPAPAGRRGAGAGVRRRADRTAPGHLRAGRVTGRDAARRARQARRPAAGAAARCTPRRSAVVRVSDPAADLALALAIASAARELPLPLGTVVLGEVGLAGEVRRVPVVERRLAEAGRLGFTRAVVPVGCGPAPDGVTAVEVADVRAALAALRPLARR